MNNRTNNGSVFEIFVFIKTLINMFGARIYFPLFCLVITRNIRMNGTSDAVDITMAEQ